MTSIRYRPCCVRTTSILKGSAANRYVQLCLYDPSMSTLSIIQSQRLQSVGMLTHHEWMSLTWPVSIACTCFQEVEAAVLVEAASEWTQQDATMKAHDDVDDAGGG